MSQSQTGEWDGWLAKNWIGPGQWIDGGSWGLVLQTERIEAKDSFWQDLFCSSFYLSWMVVLHLEEGGFQWIGSDVALLRRRRRRDLSRLSMDVVRRLLVSLAAVVERDDWIWYRLEFNNNKIIFCWDQLSCESGGGRFMNSHQRIVPPSTDPVPLQYSGQGIRTLLQVLLLLRFTDCWILNNCQGRPRQERCMLQTGV